MITLLSYRYGRLSSSEYKTFDEAAIAAVFQVEFNTAYPSQIIDGDTTLWQNDGSGEEMDRLRKIAIEAGHLLDN